MEWIQTNPGPVLNTRLKYSMAEESFQPLLRRLMEVTSSETTKLETLFFAKGNYTAEQAAHILSMFKRPDDKVKALEMMEPRLCQMTCQQARNIIASFSISRDKLVALTFVKRALCDAHMSEGADYILSAFVYPEDKAKAAEILCTVVVRAAGRVPAGGHQGYGALGGLQTQNRPLLPHMYGSVPAQMAPPVHELKFAKAPTIHKTADSYKLPEGGTYAQRNGFPGHPQHLDPGTSPLPYPGGAPPLGYHSSAPASTGFVGSY